MWCLKVRTTAPSLTLKSLTLLSLEPESACWLSGSATKAFTCRVQLEGVLVGAVEEPHADCLSSEPLRMRWPSGIAATAFTSPVCPAQVLTRLLLATLHTLTKLSPSR